MSGQSQSPGYGQSYSAPGMTPQGAKPQTMPSWSPMYQQGPGGFMQANQYSQQYPAPPSTGLSTLPLPDGSSWTGAPPTPFGMPSSGDPSPYGQELHQPQYGQPPQGMPATPAITPTGQTQPVADGRFAQQPNPMTQNQVRNRTRGLLAQDNYNVAGY